MSFAPPCPAYPCRQLNFSCMSWVIDDVAFLTHSSALELRIVAFGACPATHDAVRDSVYGCCVLVFLCLALLCLSRVCAFVRSGWGWSNRFYRTPTLMRVRFKAHFVLPARDLGAVLPVFLSRTRRSVQPGSVLTAVWFMLFRWPLFLRTAFFRCSSCLCVF